MEAYFVSDIHLKSVNERNSQILLRFLNSLMEKPPTHLFLLGDIFDLWIGRHQIFAQKFAMHVNAIEKLSRLGVKIVYFEGNHDFHLSGFWTESVGVEVCLGPKKFELGSHIVRAEHGDLINENDLAYQRYYKFSRHKATEWVLQNLPSQSLKLFGENFSKISRLFSKPQREEKKEELRQMIRGHAKKMSQTETFDLIITGHLHVKDDFEFENQGKKIRSINLGSWFDKAEVFYLSDKQSKWIEL